ncbi:MAG TPA: transglycosylase SLT domain-containing protein, partial [Woeseiaceae bacterium]|nr:transglycosylase SLT domain-containing protein [Woeseiaceae bacterium]
MHDNRHLGVVYAEIEVPVNLPDRTRQRQVDAERDKIRAALQTLAGGKRDGLSPTEEAVLAAWGGDTGNATFREARERVRFQRGLADRFRAGLERSGRWRPFIEREFAALGVPAGLAALPHVESSYNPEARSHVGASGIWQFTRSTGRRFLRIDHVLDERNDPFAASRAAGQLLAYNHSITGNWPTAITAYNHGLGGVRRAMREYGDTAYVDILRKYDGRTFGFASRNFYVAFLAALEVDLNAERWFPGLKHDEPEEYELLRLANYISAPALAGALGIEPGEFARHNGALQPTVWQESKLVPRDYEVRIPSRLLREPVDQLVAAIPESDWASEQLPDLFHTIARGDTLSQIADHYGTTVTTLVALNDLGSRHRIRAGQQLRLPAAGPAPAPAEAEVATAVESEVEAAVDAEPAADASLAEPTPAALSGEPEGVAATGGGEAKQTELLSDPSDYSVSDDATIEVQPLETLGHYADWLGIRTQRLRDVNGFAFGTPVAVGERIRLAFDEVDAVAFESRRVAYHRAQQDQYFGSHTITGVREHVIARGESVWVLSLREYGVPLWLFRQYNPGFDLHRVRPGTRVSFPVLVDRGPE